MPLLVLFCIYIFKKEVFTERLEKRIGSLFEGLKARETNAMQYCNVFMIRRVLFGMLCIYFSDYPCLQIMIFSCSSIYVLMYIVLVEPFKESSLNLLEIYNELVILAVSYHLFVFSDFAPDFNLQYLFGFSVIFIVSFSIAINLIVQFVIICRELKYKIRKLRLRRKITQTNQQSMVQDSLLTTKRVIQEFQEINVDNEEIKIGFDENRGRKKAQKALSIIVEQLDEECCQNQGNENEISEKCSQNPDKKQKKSCNLPNAVEMTIQKKLTDQNLDQMRNSEININDSGLKKLFYTQRRKAVSNNCLNNLNLSGNQDSSGLIDLPDNFWNLGKIPISKLSQSDLSDNSSLASRD